MTKLIAAMLARFAVTHRAPPERPQLPTAIGHPLSPEEYAAYVSWMIDMGSS
jgi:hypothetical protein